MFSRALVLFGLFGTLFSCSPKEPNLETLISHIRNDYPNEHFSIAPSMAAIFIDETLPGGSEFKALMEGFASMEVIVISSTKGIKDNNLDKLFNTVNMRLDRQDLTQLGQFRSEKEIVDVWGIRTTVITDLVVVNQTASFLYIVHFKGDIDEQKVVAFLHPENRPILDYLYRLKPNS